MDEMIEIACEVIVITEAKILVDTGTQEGWVPQVEIRKTYKNGKQCMIDELQVGDADVVIEIPEWLAREKGFI